MACGDLPDIDLPKIEKPTVPKVPGVSIPEYPVDLFPLVPLVPNFHLNIFDITILLYMLFNGLPLSSYNTYNAFARDQILDLMANPTSASPDFPDPLYANVALTKIEISSNAAFVKGANVTQDNIFDMLNRNYDEVGCELLEIMFGYCDTELQVAFNNYKHDSRKLQRV
tara:strand:- start:4089 stop:4595 length:507 start_codon:yes stop_codon:yes gene_type:complete